MSGILSIRSVHPFCFLHFFFPKSSAGSPDTASAHSPAFCEPPVLCNQGSDHKQRTCDQKTVLEARPFQDTIADAGREQRGGQINTNRILLHLLRRQRKKEIVPFSLLPLNCFPFSQKSRKTRPRPLHMHRSHFPAITASKITSFKILPPGINSSSAAGISGA